MEFPQWHTTKGAFNLSDVESASLGSHSFISPSSPVSWQTVFTGQSTTLPDATTQYLLERIRTLEIRLSSLESQSQQEMPVPKNLNIANLRSSRLTLKQALPIHIDYSDGVYIAFSADLNNYGRGETEMDAIEDLCYAIEEDYFELKSQKMLGPALQPIFDFMRTVISEVDYVLQKKTHSTRARKTR